MTCLTVLATYLYRRFNLVLTTIFGTHPQCGTRLSRQAPFLWVYCPVNVDGRQAQQDNGIAGGCTWDARTRRFENTKKSFLRSYRLILKRIRTALHAWVTTVHLHSTTRLKPCTKRLSRSSRACISPNLFALQQRFGTICPFFLGFWNDAL
jgi:hypothetical protein